MSDAWEKKLKAEEESYFEKQEHKALSRIKALGPNKSPVTGEPMTPITVEGVTAERCPASGGVWLAKGEIEKILARTSTQPEKYSPFSIVEFLERLLK